MGQGLSCVSKKNETLDLERKPARPLKKSKKVKLLDVEVTNGKTDVEVNEEIQPIGYNRTEAAAPVVRPRLVLHPAAPRDFKLPSPIPATPSDSTNVDPALKETNFSTLPLLPQTEPTYTKQPVDTEARELAQSPAKHATWKDLYWHLIGSRNLSSDKDKVRVLFSWLCSRPIRQSVFASIEELEEAVKQDVPGAKEALESKQKDLPVDSLEIVLEELAKEQSTYSQAFESLCRYSGIPCRTIRGLVKGVGYTVGMKLADELPVSPGQTSRLQHTWNAAYIDNNWELFDCTWATKRLAVAPTTRNSQLSQTSKMEYEMDMFYFKPDPAKLIYSHFPFDDQWQLLKPPMTLKTFEESVQLKPFFFRHGLGLFTHNQGVIHVQNKLVLKLNIPRDAIKSLLFTFNLSFEGIGEGIDHANLNRFGIHEVSAVESTVTFIIRLPRDGAYKLTIYARKSGVQIFSDVCEYRVEASGVDTSAGAIMPFPPTTQSSYGPTEKASDLGLATVPRNLDSTIKGIKGMLEIRFISENQTGKLPRLIARLRSLLHDPAHLDNCVLVREAEAVLPTTLTSLRSSCTIGAGVPMVLVTCYFPSAGEYGLEIYGTSSDADESVTYPLAWQFLVDVEIGTTLTTPVRKRFAAMHLGPYDDQWKNLNLHTVSHPDPLIHVPTVARAGSTQKVHSKGELLQQYAERSETANSPISTNLLNSVTEAKEITAGVTEEAPQPRDHDLKIVIETPGIKQVRLVGQLVDISESDEEDRTMYLVQTTEEENGEQAVGTTERVNYLIRIPKGGRFYKLYLYANVTSANLTESIPLVYTYLVEAPARLMSSEVPYIGAKLGPFPEKVKQQEALQQARAKAATATAVAVKS